MRRLQGAAVADEISGSVIVWDSLAETFNVRGGAATAANPGGRVRAVIAPRAQADAVPVPATPATGLQLSPTLGNRQ